MGYTPEMLESIKNAVEATRERRLKETYRRLTQQEKEDLLRSFHPDYRPDAQREILVGPNKGERMPHEHVDLLEGVSRIDPDSFDLNKIDYDVDVLVIGGGGAGSTAALIAQEAGANVLLVTKLRHGDANTMMAEGGIQAATKEIDSPAIHFIDCIGGGHFSNIPELVAAMTHDAPICIHWLESLGCMFNKEPDGTLKTLHGGGTSRKRMHSAHDCTGAEIMRTLRDEVRNRAIPVIEFCAAVELLTDESGAVNGAILYNMETQAYQVVRAKTVVIATGGSGRLHINNSPTSNHYGATGDGLVIAYRAGAKLIYLDATQFHPTGVAYPEQTLGLLVTEKVRGMGAQLVNTRGEQFIYPLETRDVVSSAIIRECWERKNGFTTNTGRVGVWLDSPMIDILHGPGTIERDLPAMYRQYIRFDIDMAKHPILMYPTLHYQNGGILINDRAESTVPNLYVAGEASGGVHGRNRLMGNSLLDIITFGRRAGKNAAEKARSVIPGKLTLNHTRKFNEEVKQQGIGKVSSPMVLPDYVGRPF
ncbi:MAG: FAD-binding protein [Firmicutes bacterium]|nr:FAD-binding protein [Bacillota bacterium]